MRVKHPNDYNKGKNGFVSGNPRWNRQAEDAAAFELDQADAAAFNFVEVAEIVEDDHEIYLDNFSLPPIIHDWDDWDDWADWADYVEDSQLQDELDDDLDYDPSEWD